MTIDCAGTFAAAGVATHAASWRLVVSAWHLALGPFDSSGWRTRTFEGQGTTFERHGALFAAPALAFEAHLDVDGVTVASSACGAAPFA